MDRKEGFRTSTPESVGIGRESIDKAIEHLRMHKSFLHSLLVMRHGCLVASVYSRPWDIHTPHRLFSVTKSIASVLIGMLAKEGRISLDDTICSYFPEYAGINPDPRLRRMTIRDALMMRTVRSSTPHKLVPGSKNVLTYSDNWTKSFFEGQVDHDPGVFFWYDDNSTHVLGSIVEKVTGESLLEYANRTVFKHLGIESAIWIKDRAGTCNANSGLMLSSYDLLKFAAFVMDGCDGFADREYIKTATAKQTDNSMAYSGSMDLSYGYGYLYWMHSRRGWMMYGTGGQFAACIPEKDMIIVINGDNQIVNHAQTVLDALWIIADSAGDGSPDGGLPYEKELELPYAKNPGMLSSYPRSLHASFSRNDMDLRTLSLEHDGNKGTLTIAFGRERHSFTFGIGRNEESPLSFHPEGTVALSSLGMTDDGAYLFLSQFKGLELGSFMIEAKVSGNTVDAAVRTHGEVSFEIRNGYASGTVSQL